METKVNFIADDIMYAYTRLINDIKLHETGEHPEITFNYLDKFAENLHYDVIRVLNSHVNAFMDAFNKYGSKVYDQKEYTIHKEYITLLYMCACSLRDIAWGEDEFEESYGIDFFDTIGADFTFPHTDKFKYLFYDYEAAYEYLLEYKLIDEETEQDCE